MIRWYCYQMDRGREQDAAAQIRSQGFEVRAIQEEYQRIVRGALVACYRQLFPGYGFVQFDRHTQQWRKINSSRNGVRLVTSGGENPIPMSISEKSMEVLMECVDDAGMYIDPEKQHASRPWEALQDQHVRIDRGSFAGFNGLCKKTDSERVKVLMTMFGEEREIEIDYRHLVKI